MKIELQMGCQRTERAALLLSSAVSSRLRARCHESVIGFMSERSDWYVRVLESGEATIL